MHGAITVDGDRVEPLGPATRDAFAGLAERHNGVWGGCWCTWFHLYPDPKEERRALGNREFERRLVERGRTHAALVLAVRGALALIAATGDGLVEAHPHDLPPDKKTSASFLYSAARTMFAQLGFEHQRPKGQGNCVMTKEIPAESAQGS